MTLPEWNYLRVLESALVNSSYYNQLLTGTISGIHQLTSLYALLSHFAIQMNLLSLCRSGASTSYDLSSYPANTADPITYPAATNY
ncbi:hypothetical protein ACTXT7_000676 [Hymenolepis weldensis]